MDFEKNKTLFTKLKEDLTIIEKEEEKIKKEEEKIKKEGIKDDCERISKALYKFINTEVNVENKKSNIFGTNIFGEDFYFNNKNMNRMQLCGYNWEKLSKKCSEELDRDVSIHLFETQTKGFIYMHINKPF